MPFVPICAGMSARQRPQLARRFFGLGGAGVHMGVAATGFLEEADGARLELGIAVHRVEQGLKVAPRAGSEDGYVHADCSLGKRPPVERRVPRARRSSTRRLGTLG